MGMILKSNSPGSQVRVFSSSANDTPAGSGVQKIAMSGINSSDVRTIETVNMAGTTRVTTTTSFKL